MNFSTLIQTNITTTTGGFGKLAAQAVIALVTAATLTGCASESDNGVIIDSDATTDARPISADTDQIVRNAVANIAGPMQRNLSDIENMANTVASTPAVNQMLKSISNNSAPGDSDRSIAANTNTVELNASVTTDVGIEQLLMMFIAPASGAITTRNGNTITIDPDDNNVCQELTSNSNDMTTCTQFISGFNVEIIATTNETGVATLHYDQQPVITSAYSQDSSSMDLRLQGVHSVMQQFLLLENDGGTLPETMHGVLTVSTSISEDSEGTEQVLGSLSVTEAIEIIDSAENSALSLQPSTLIAIGSSKSTETIHIDIEGLNYSEQLDNEDGTSTAVAAIKVPGFSAQIEFHDDNSLNVTRIGLGMGPVKVTINDFDMINLTLAQFGFQIDGDNRLLTLTDALDFNLILNNVSGYLGDDFPSSFSAQFSAIAAANTALLEQENESIKVISGGPINIEYQINDGVRNPADSFTVSSGECFDLSGNFEDSINQLATTIPCE